MHTSVAYRDAADVNMTPVEQMKAKRLFPSSDAASRHYFGSCTYSIAEESMLQTYGPIVHSPSALFILIFILEVATESIYMRLATAKVIITVYGL